jgi:putative membrane protein
LPIRHAPKQASSLLVLEAHLHHRLINVFGFIMSPKLKEFLQRWAVTTVAVLIAEYLITGIRYDNWKALMVATLLLGILNAFLRPLILVATVGLVGIANVIMGLRTLMATLPLQIALFGFFLLAINAILLLLVAKVVPGFYVDDFWTAFKGGLAISFISVFVNSATGTGGARVQIRRGKPPHPPDRSDGDNGPIIDV